MAGSLAVFKSFLYYESTLSPLQHSFKNILAYSEITNKYELLTEVLNIHFSNIIHKYKLQVWSISVEWKDYKI